MPTIALALPIAAEVLRMTRSTMLETIRQDYIRTARSKGATEKIVIWRHALKNALLPVITVIGSEFGGLLGGTILIESVFAIPGLGSLVVNSIRTKDVPQVMAATLFIALIFCCLLYTSTATKGVPGLTDRALAASGQPAVQSQRPPACKAETEAHKVLPDRGLSAQKSTGKARPALKASFFSALQKSRYRASPTVPRSSTAAIFCGIQIFSKASVQSHQTQQQPAVPS